jgi:hypothetical protein
MKNFCKGIAPSAALAWLCCAAPAWADGGREWKKAVVEIPQQDGGKHTETRVMRSDGTEVSVGDGLKDVGLQERLSTLARPPTDAMTLLRDNVGRVGVLAVAGGMLLGGSVAAVAGGVLWGLSLAHVAPSSPPVLGQVFAEGLFVLLGGLTGMAVGVFTLVVAVVPWVWQWLRPEAADPETVKAAAASRAWDDATASDVVARHNAQVNKPREKPAPAPRRAVKPAPKRAPDPDLEEESAEAPDEEAPPPPRRRPRL